MRVLFIIYIFLVEVVSAATLLLCGVYLITKITMFFKMQELFIALSFVGMGLTIYYIHESLFRDRREKAWRIFKEWK